MSPTRHRFGIDLPRDHTDYDVAIGQHAGGVRKSARWVRLGDHEVTHVLLPHKLRGTTDLIRSADGEYETLARDIGCYASRP